MKFTKLIEGSNSDKIGMATIGGQNIQFCDHVEKIDDKYYATALAIEVNDPKYFYDNNVVKTVSDDGSQWYYITEELLNIAKPTYGDQQTADMIKRLKDTISYQNKIVYRAAA